MGERRALHAGSRAHARHPLQKGQVLGVINLIEERFLGWIDIHADDENVTRGERNGLASLDGETGCTTFYVSPICNRFVSMGMRRAGK